MFSIQDACRWNADEIQVHAESSKFVAGVSKSDAYKQVIEQAEALFEGQRNWVRRKTLTREVSVN